MKKLLLIVSACAVAVLMSSSFAWAQEGPVADRYLGTWEFDIVGTEVGTIYMDLIVRETEGGLAASMGDPAMGFEMVFEDINATDSALTANAGIEGFPEADTQVKLMRRDETTMSVEMGGEQFVATKKEE